MNRRKFARIALATRIKVVFRGMDQRDSMLIQNLSEGGLFLESELIKPIGTILNFEFRVRDHTEIIKGQGRVCWVEKGEDRYGMGIQFMALNQEGQEIIGKLYRRRDQNSAKQNNNLSIL